MDASNTDCESCFRPEAAQVRRRKRIGELAYDLNRLSPHPLQGRGRCLYFRLSEAHMTALMAAATRRCEQDTKEMSALLGASALKIPSLSDPASLTSFGEATGNEAGTRPAVALEANCAQSHYAGI